MRRFILLDAGPLGLLAFSRAIPIAVECNQWIQSMLAAGDKIVVPEITDYEVRRELVYGGLIGGVRRLDRLTATSGITYLPLTTQTMRRAADLWAEARRLGRPTADPKALDCDVILAAQAQLIDEPDAGVLVATANVSHLSRFVEAAHWQSISP